MAELLTDVRRAVSTRLFKGNAETTGSIELEEFGVAANDEFAHYVPSAWWMLRWQLARSDVEPGDVFVEFGCGKGRIVLDAARRYPFARVIGVELVPELADDARQLIAAQQPAKLRTERVEIVTSDARQFAIPADMTHVYLFNPFFGSVLAEVVQNILASIDAHPRTVRLIYVEPTEHDELMATGRFRLVRYQSTTRLVSRTHVAVYDIVPR
jgi:precorrin-6B methylase 2